MGGDGKAAAGSHEMCCLCCPAEEEGEPAAEAAPAPAIEAAPAPAEAEVGPSDDNIMPGTSMVQGNGAC